MGGSDKGEIVLPLVAAPPAAIATGGCRRLQSQAALAVDFATWVAIASISAGDRQS
jgi:hypothetical protein